jgi:hypothetical protein
MRPILVGYYLDVSMLFVLGALILTQYTCYCIQGTSAARSIHAGLQ